MNEHPALQTPSTVVTSAAMVSPTMAKMLRRFDDPPQITPPTGHMRISALEGENAYALSYNGADVMIFRFPDGVKPGLRFHSDGDFQSEPFVQQFLTWTTQEAEVRVTLRMPCEWWNVRPGRAERGTAILGQVGAPLLYGINGAYVPLWDLLISWHGVPFRWQGDTITETMHAYSAEMTVRMGNQPMVVLVRPHYYSEHLGFRHHQPWLRRPKPNAICGWCSWEAYHDEVSMEGVRQTVEALRPLQPYGLSLVQIDDGYQNPVVPCAPNADVGESWLNTNDKFPGGHEEMVSTIRGGGFTPGIWMNATLTDRENAESIGCCLKDRDGRLICGDWIQYVMDCKPETLARHVTACCSQLRAKGYDYFKTDSIRHLLYDGLQEAVRRGLMEPNEARARHRAYMEAVREGIGEDVYLLSCWGVLSSSIGLCDAMRVATDANPSWRAFSMQVRETARWYSAQRILFTVDPDHVCVRAKTPWVRMMLSLVSLSGGLMMVSDTPQSYDEDRMDMMRRTMPPLTTHAGEVGGVDYSTPACAPNIFPDDETRNSFAIAHEAVGERYPMGSLWATHLRHGGRAWCVVQRCAVTPVAEVSISLEALALDPSQAYALYDAWSGEVREMAGRLTLNALQLGDTQVLALTPLHGETPVLVGSDRHVSCDAISVAEAHADDEGYHMTLCGFEGLQATYTLYAPTLRGEVCSQGCQAVCEREGKYLRLRVSYHGRSASVHLS